MILWVCVHVDSEPSFSSAIRQVLCTDPSSLPCFHIHSTLQTLVNATVFMSDLQMFLQKERIMMDWHYTGILAFVVFELGRLFLEMACTSNL